MFEKKLNLEPTKGLKEQKNTASRFILSSVLALAFNIQSLKAQANNNLNPIDSTTMEVKPTYKIDENVYQEVKKLVLEQKEWILNYIQSEKYKELLSKEFLIWKKYGDTPENMMIKYSFDEKGDTARIINLKESYVEVKKSPSLRPGETRDLLLPSMFFQQDISQLTEEDKITIDQLIASRVNNVETHPWIIVPSLSGRVTGKYFEKSNKDSLYGIPSSGLIVFGGNMLPDATQTPVHEDDHQSLDGKNEMLSTSVYLLENIGSFPGFFNDKDKEYLGKASERKARFTALKMLAHKYKIYDPNTEDFTKDHLEKVKNTPEVKNNHNVEEILEMFGDEYIIMIMNTIAGLDDKDYNLVV